MLTFQEELVHAEDGKFLESHVTMLLLFAEMTG
jgi:hypothetical protein